MKKINLILPMLIISTVSFNSSANMSSWLDAPSTKSDDMSEILDGFYGKSLKVNNSGAGNNKMQVVNQSDSNSVVENLEQRPQSGLQLAQQQRLKNLSEITENNIQQSLSTGESSDNFSEPESAQDQPVQQQPVQQSTQPKNQSEELAANVEREQMQEQQRLEDFITKSQQFLNPNTLSSLPSDHSTAITVLNSALMEVGVEAMSGMQAKQSNANFNKAIGCINSFASQSLNQASQQLISQYSSVANISAIVRSSPQIGGRYVAKCY